MNREYRKYILCSAHMLLLCSYVVVRFLSVCVLNGCISSTSRCWCPATLCLVGSIEQLISSLTHISSYLPIPTEPKCTVQ